MCFFAGGTRFSEQGFRLSATQLNSSLLTISVIAVLLPAAFHLTVSSSDSNEGADILKVSHGVAIILLFSKFFFFFTRARILLISSCVFLSLRLLSRIPTRLAQISLPRGPRRRRQINYLQSSAIIVAVLDRQSSQGSGQESAFGNGTEYQAPHTEVDTEVQPIHADNEDTEEQPQLLLCSCYCGMACGLY